MTFLLAVLALGVLIGAVASVIGYVLFHAAPRFPVTARRLTAPALAALLVMIPAFVGAFETGTWAVVQTLLFAGVLATIFGYPMARVFEPRPREKD